MKTSLAFFLVSASLISCVWAQAGLVSTAYAERDDWGLQRHAELGSYSLLSKSWFYFGDLAYRTSLLVDGDGNFLGVSFSLMNRSRSESLTLSRRETLKVPFLVHIRDEQDNPLKKEDPEIKRPASVKWTIKPRETETHFIPAIRFLPEDFQENRTKKYCITVYLAAAQEGYIRGGHVGPLPANFCNLGITNASTNGTKTLFQKMSEAAKTPSPRYISDRRR